MKTVPTKRAGALRREARSTNKSTHHRRYFTTWRSSGRQQDDFSTEPLLMVEMDEAIQKQCDSCN